VEEAVVVVGPGLGVAAVESPEVQLVLDWQQENNTYIACYNNTRHMIHNLIQIYQKIITYSTQLSLTNLAVQHIS
jgi:putative methionine-R-sulfoxide reductase with GAF domain